MPQLWTPGSLRISLCQLQKIVSVVSELMSKLLVTIYLNATYQNPASESHISSKNSHAL
jgi:hypothetical protein